MYYRRHYEGENRNISAATEEVNIRDIMERKYIMYDIMENVTDEYFMEAFKDDFVLPKDSDGFCIECEKFSVMLNSRVVPVHASIFYYFNHYNDERFRYHLENFYHVKRKDFWKITGIEHDRGILVDHDKQMINDLSNMVCALKQLVWEKDMEIARLKESHE